MALPGSGAIALSDIADEFGGSTPHSMSEYYSGGLGPSEVPASGAISFSDFYGTSSVPDWAGSRSMYAGGYTTAYSNVVQTKTVASTSNLTHYGALVYGRGTHGSLSSQTYMFSAGGYGASGASNMIDRKVFASNANATDRADLQSETQYNNPSGVSSTTALFCFKVKSSYIISVSGVLAPTLLSSSIAPETIIFNSVVSSGISAVIACVAKSSPTA